MSDSRTFFHLQNLQDDFIKYYCSSQKHRIDEIRLSRLGILYGAATLNRRIEYIFQNEETKGMVICAHLKHSKIHDFYIIAACLIYGYTLLHSNWHTDNEEVLFYKLRSTNCRLVIVDDEIETDCMLPDVKYLRLSDVYAQSIHNRSVSLCNSLSLVESLGKDRADHRIQEMLGSQSKLMSSIKKDSVMMITFTSGGPSRRPRARKVTYGDMLGHFKGLDAMGSWSHDDVLVVFMANPTYDYFTSVVLYYCLRRPNVHLHFLQRYMSTYWKILWEANEHAKNVFLQLGKNYKIVSFLYPRQLEALLTLEEVAHECQLFDLGDADDDLYPLLKKLSTTRSLIATKTSDSLSPSKELVEDLEQQELLEVESCETNQDEPLQADSMPYHKSSSLGRVSKIIFGKNKSTWMSSISGARKVFSPRGGLSSHVDPLDGETTSGHRSASMQRITTGRAGSSYIPKLHLKLSELRNVLCDKNVVFLLSGTYASFDLCRIFANLTGGKTPFIRYGCTEISPTITLVPPMMDRQSLLELYNMGVHNTFNGRRASGHYIGIAVSADMQLSVVKSVDPRDLSFLVECSSGEPGYIVCNVIDSSRLLFPGNINDTVLQDGTYLGIGDMGFFLDIDEVRHFYWLYNVDSSIPPGINYPYLELLETSKIVQRSICTRYGLTAPVVRVETVKLLHPDGSQRIVCAVELITAKKADIAQDIKNTFLDMCKSVGMFEDCQVPDEIRVMSIPWAYKGTVNYPVLRDMLMYKSQ